MPVAPLSQLPTNIPGWPETNTDLAARREHVDAQRCVVRGGDAANAKWRIKRQVHHGQNYKPRRSYREMTQSTGSSMQNEILCQMNPPDIAIVAKPFRHVESNGLALSLSPLCWGRLVRFLFVFTKGTKSASETCRYNLGRVACSCRLHSLQSFPASPGPKLQITASSNC